MLSKQPKTNLRSTLVLLALAALGAVLGALVGQGIGGDPGALVMGLLMAILVALMGWLGVFRKKASKHHAGPRRSARRKR